MKGLLFTYCLTYGGSFVAIFNPFYGLLIYICFAIVKPPALWHWSVPPGNYSRIIAIAFLTGWALNGFGTRSLGKARPIVLCLFAYWAWVTVSTVASPDPVMGWPFVELLGKIVLPFVAGVTLIDSIEKLKLLAYVILFSTAYLAFEANLSYFEGTNAVLNSKFLGMDNNGFSILIVTGAGLAFFLGLNAKHFLLKWGAFACAGLMAHVPMFAMSRGGLLALIVVGMTTFLLLPKNAKYISYFALAVVTGLILAGENVRNEFSTVFLEAEERDASAQGRLQLWGDCWELMLANPIVGIGQDRWPVVAPQFDWPLGKEAHSLWFQTAAELGVPGVLFLISFYLVTIYLMLKLIRAASSFDDPWFVMAGQMTIASLVGFMVASSFVSVEAHELPYYIALLAAGALKIAPDYTMVEAAEPLAPNKYASMNGDRLCSPTLC